MEPFAIHCTTCKTRLVVRDPAAIGQILACPRCASMVLVERPAGLAAGGLDAGKPASDANAATGAATGDKSSAEKQIVRPKGARGHDSRADTLGDTFDDLDDLLAGRAAPAPSAPPADAVAPAPEVARRAAGPPSDSTPSAVGDESSAADAPLERVGRWSPTTIVAAAGGVGVLLAASAALILIVGFGGGGPPVAVNPPPPAEAPGDGEGGSSRDDGPAVTDGTGRDSDEPKQGTPPGADPPAPAAPTTESPPPEPTPPTTDGPPAKPEAPAKPGAEKPGAEKPKSEDGASEFAPKPAETRRPRSTIGGIFADFLNNAPLSGRGAPEEGAARADAPKPPATDDGAKPSDSPAERPALPRPLAREVDLDARLADELAAASYHETPLVDFLAEISDLSTIPVTLDLRALAARRVSPATPISVKLQNVSVEKLLAAALEPLQLVARRESDGQLVVTLAADETTRAKIEYPVDDLTGGDANAVESLASLVATFVTPDAWTGAGGTATLETDPARLTVDGLASTHVELEWFLDKLRVARKRRPLAKSAFPAGALAVDATLARGADKLAAPLKLNFARPTRLTAILQRLGRDAGVRIVPNWQSLGAIGWTTETQATLSVEGKSLAESLSALLAPMELDYRVVDDATIEVLAARTAPMTLDVEFHTLAGLGAADPDSLLRKLETECGTERFASAGGTASLRYDAPSQCLVAAAPFALQRKIAEVLGAWRKDADAKAP